MTRIDFYVLSSIETAERFQLICRLTEKAIARREKVFIHSDSAEQLSALDAMLWNFRALSFIPHSLFSASNKSISAQNDPVHLSVGIPATDRTLLINLANEVPLFFSRFERTLEVINEQPSVRAAGRSRYRFYQQRGYPLQHHKM